MHLPERQRGAALLILLALFATATVYMLVRSLNKSSVALSLERADKNRQVMQEAKAALLAWAASQALTASVPGALPCPDRDNDGDAEGSCGSSNRLGRLPYKTLGIGELRDASGELLWYGMSANFRTTSTVNSDTQGTITVSGLTPATNAVAVVLAPGARLGTQDRSPGGAACNTNTQPCNSAVNYLEDINGDTTTTDYVARAENLDAAAGTLFNDGLLVITQQDLLSAVEPVIAARIERDIVRQYIYDSDISLTDTSKQWSDNSANRNKSRYFDAWGRFPFAAPFDPSSSNPTGQAGTYEGSLPVVDNLSYSWSSPGVVQTGGTGSVSSVNCGNTTNAKLICRIVYVSGAPTIRMSGSVTRVGRSFVQLSQLSEVTTNGGSLSARSLSGSVDSAGVGTVMLDATLPDSGAGANTVTITFNNGTSKALIANSLTSASDPVAGWFTSNDWHLLTYYAVSTGYAPGGAGSCTAGVTCLTVNNLTTAPTNNKYAILMLAGRSLNGSGRPSSTPGDYLEAQNASTGDRIFEHGLRDVSSTGGAINDRAVVIAP